MMMTMMRQAGKTTLLMGLLILTVAPGTAQDRSARERQAEAERRARVEMEAAREAMEQARAEMQEVRIRMREMDGDCRCVDEDGNEIENCSCLRIPEMEFGMNELALMGRRAQIGVWVDGGLEAAATGAPISEVMEDGPAWEAGIRAGDVVTHVAGQSVLQPLPDADAEADLDDEGPVAVQRFVYLVGNLEPEEEVEFRVLRDGERRTFTVTPAAAGMNAFTVRRGDGPVVFWNEDGNELRLELDRHMEVLRNQEMLSREEQEELRREMEELRGLTLRFRGRPDAPEPPVFGFRGDGDRAATVWGFRGPGEGQNGFVMLGGDPCFASSAEAGERGAVSIFRSAGNCVDGVELVELNPELAEYFDAPADGVLVTEVAEAATLGLRAGDVLVAIGGREVRDPGHARRILQSYELDEEVRLRIVRQGREMEVLGHRREP